MIQKRSQLTANFLLHGQHTPERKLARTTVRRALYRSFFKIDFRRGTVARSLDEREHTGADVASCKRYPCLSRRRNDLRVPAVLAEILVVSNSRESERRRKRATERTIIHTRATRPREKERNRYKERQGVLLDAQGASEQYHHTICGRFAE